MKKLLILAAGLMLSANADANAMSKEFVLMNEVPALIVDLTHPRPDGAQQSYIYRICRSQGNVEVYRTTSMFRKQPPVRPVAVLKWPQFPCRDILLHKGEMLILRNGSEKAVATYDLVGG